MTETTNSLTVLTWDALRDSYSATSGLTMTREHGHTKNGVSIWALREGEGTLVDTDILRSNIARRQNLRLIDEFSEAAEVAKGQEA